MNQHGKTRPNEKREVSVPRGTIDGKRKKTVKEGKGKGDVSGLDQ